MQLCEAQGKICEKKQAGELYDEIEQRARLAGCIMELINRIEAWIKDNVFSLDITMSKKII